MLRGGGGDDALDGDGTFGDVDLGGSDDLLDGGDGTDAVTFAQRGTPVGVDLAARTAGGDGERDALVSIEDAVGGAGADTLLGDGLANTLAGGGGNDHMAAGGGDDVLYGRAGIDRLDGGEGDDHLEVTDEGDVAIGGAGADRLDGQTGTRLDGGDGDDILGFFGSPAGLVCGAGFDAVESNALAGTRLDGCEQVVVGAFGLLSVGVAPIPRPQGILVLPVGCRAQGSSVVTGCRGGVELALRRPGKRPLRLGRATFRLRAGQRATARLRLSARGRRTLRSVAHPLLELRLGGHGTLESTYHAPGGVDQRPSLAGSWRVRL